MIFRVFLCIKVYDEKKWIVSEFINEDDVYKKSFLMMYKQFLMQVSIAQKNEVRLVYDMSTLEKCAFVHMLRSRDEFDG